MAGVNMKFHVSYGEGFKTKAWLTFMCEISIIKIIHSDIIQISGKVGYIIICGVRQRTLRVA